VRAPPPADVIVIGAGIVGLCSALALQARGARVRLFDPLGFGQGCSYGNAGLINADAHLPVAMPGMPSQVPRWLLASDSPLSVRPADALRELPFLWRWLAASRMAAAWRSILALRALHSNVLAHYRTLLGNDYHRHIIEAGGLTLLPGEKPTPAERRATQIRKRLGIAAEMVDRAGLDALVPGLSPSLQRALFFPGHAHCHDPAALCAALGARVLAQGGRLEKVQVVGITSTAGGCLVVTDAGPSEAAGAVIAAGIGSRHLLRELRARIPLAAERGYHLQLEAPSVALPMGVIHRAGGFALTPIAGGLRLAGTIEIAAPDAPPKWSRADLILARARALLPALRFSSATRWMGARPSLPDSVAAIGPVPGHRHIFAAVGHGHDGMIGAPASGQLIAEMLTGGAPHIPPAPYRLDRFGVRDSFCGPAVEDQGDARGLACAGSEG